MSANDRTYARYGKAWAWKAWVWRGLGASATVLNIWMAKIGISFILDGKHDVAKCAFLVALMLAGVVSGIRTLLLAEVAA
jgi:hypothetical protein